MGCCYCHLLKLDLEAALDDTEVKTSEVKNQQLQFPSWPLEAVISCNNVLDRKSVV